MLEKFITNIKSQQLFSAADPLLLAVSGGIDSIVLCELCKQAGYSFSIAHCNFQLRGEESDRDEAFVKELAAKYDVSIHIKKFDTETYALRNRQSIQEAARDLRYGWFEELLSAGMVLLTAHHADDNIETVLMNFFRGTGLQGLTGIPAINGKIRRPLLIFSREELVAFATANQLTHVEDSSNQSVKYTRNLFRHKIIPEIETVYPQTKENLRANIDRFNAIAQLYQQGVEMISKKLCKQKGKETHIPVKQLMGFNNKALIYEIIKPYDFTEKQVDELVKLASSESGRYIQSPSNSFRIIRHRHWFIISPVVATDSANIIIEPADKTISFSGGQLEIEQLRTSNLPAGRQAPNSELLTKATSNKNAPNSIATLDAKEISFPLLLRRWKAGDYFYPLGMKKKKKVARFLIDQKLSKTEKENVWVIEMNKKIIWVVGHRIDDRFRVTDSTLKTIRLELRN